MSTRPKVGMLTTPGAPFAGRVLSELRARDVPVNAVILDAKGFSEKDQRIHADRTAGRLPPVALEDFATESISFHDVASHNAPETASLIKWLGLDILVNSETPRILHKLILDAPRIGILNCDPGLLPAFRGCTCVEWAIYYDQQVGNTVHLMSEGIDKGPIVAREGLTFATTDTYVDVRVEVFTAGIRLLAGAAADIYFGRLAPENFERQGEGRYFDIIDEKKMAAVKRKLVDGVYAYQRSLV